MQSKHATFVAGLVIGLIVLSGVSAVATGFRFGPLPFSSGISGSGADSGSENEIRDVKLAVVDLYQNNMELSNLTQAEQQSIGLEPDNDLGITLRNGLRGIWVQSVADKNFADIVMLYKKENGQGPEFTWDHVQLEVTEWQGVEVNDNIASAQFVSRYVFTRDGHSAPDLETQWKVELARQSSSGGWLLISRKGADLENR
jgi:hypothetical protein